MYDLTQPLAPGIPRFPFLPLALGAADDSQARVVAWDSSSRVRGSRRESGLLAAHAG
jgi:hypothetical protein